MGGGDRLKTSEYLYMGEGSKIAQFTLFDPGITVQPLDCAKYIPVKPS